MALIVASVHSIPRPPVLGLNCMVMIVLTFVWEIDFLWARVFPCHTRCALSVHEVNCGAFGHVLTSVHRRVPQPPHHLPVLPLKGMGTENSSGFHEVLHDDRFPLPVPSALTDSDPLKNEVSDPLWTLAQLPSQPDHGLSFRPRLACQRGAILRSTHDRS